MTNLVPDSPDAARAELVIVLAAGAGTRMKSNIAKVLHPILGAPVLEHVLNAAAATDPERMVVVVGHQREAVTEFLEQRFPQATTAVQEQQNGTGHATRSALESLPDFAADVSGSVLVLAGDTPLLTAETLQALVAEHAAANNAVTVLTARVPDPSGYGRIVRGANDEVSGIVEHKDATDEQLQIDEINSGVFVFDAAVLVDGLSRLSTDNTQGEEYLTDVLGIAFEDGRPVGAYVVANPDEVAGINDRAQLAQAAAALRDRINDAHLRAGVSIIDPATTWISPGAVIEPDAVIERNTRVDADSQIAAGAVIGPDTELVATTVDADATVIRSQCAGAHIGARSQVGPYSFLRPGSVLGEDAKVGAYVEVKQSTIGTGSKVPHLSYVGDATIGTGTNIGAATVFANYDGVAKHKTVVGDEVRVGSDSMLVAPVNIGDGAYTAAGSVITEDVPPGAMAVGRARQHNIDGWVARRRPGTGSDQAARKHEQSNGDSEGPAQPEE